MQVKEDSEGRICGDQKRKMKSFKVSVDKQGESWKTIQQDNDQNHTASPLLNGFKKTKVRLWSVLN